MMSNFKRTMLVIGGGVLMIAGGLYDGMNGSSWGMIPIVIGSGMHGWILTEANVMANTLRRK